MNQKQKMRYMILGAARRMTVKVRVPTPLLWRNFKRWAKLRVGDV